MSSKIRWGVIGSGGIARRRTIPEGHRAGEQRRLVAVFDVDSEGQRGGGQAVRRHACDESGGAAGHGHRRRLHRHAGPPALRARRGLCQGGQARPLREAAGHDRRRGRGDDRRVRPPGVKLGTAFMMRFPRPAPGGAASSSSRAGSASRSTPGPSFPAGIRPSQAPGGRTRPRAAAARSWTWAGTASTCWRCSSAPWPR